MTKFAHAIIISAQIIMYVEWNVNKLVRLRRVKTSIIFTDISTDWRVIFLNGTWQDDIA